MNDRPVELIEKMEYLQDKIAAVHRQAKESEQFELKMQFIEFIDTSIDRIYRISAGKPPEEARKQYQNYYSAEENLKEKERILLERDALSRQMKSLNRQETQLQIDSLKIQLQSARVLKEKLHREYLRREQELKQHILDLELKIRSQEKELERVIKLNQAQGKEIQHIKQERNRAEKREMELRERYQTDMGLLEVFNEKTNKYSFRNAEGLKNLRTFTNIMPGGQKKSQKFVICDLPLRFHIVKIVYGVKLGLILGGKEVIYLDQVMLYEKEEMQATSQGGVLQINYLKRKTQVRIDKYKLTKPHVAIMLFGKGDSVAIDQSK